MRSGSLYIHVPFCSRKCHYCNFYIVADNESAKQRYMEALRLEWERTPKFEVQTLYFGGGTPALLGPERIGQIIEWVGCNGEITLEANPENDLDGFAGAGVNRVSIGLQSTDTAHLLQLGRRHSGPAALDAIERAATLFNNVSVDLIYDLPGQTLDEWRRTLDQTAALPITHLSLYNLTIEPKTAFFAWKERLQLPSEEESLEMVLAATERLERAGLHRYEISAFARNGLHSEHNRGYWEGRPFLGLGPSAFSFWEGRRFRNVAHLRNWAEALERGRSPVDFEENLGKEESERELTAIGLRLLEGKEGPFSPSLERDLEKEVKRGLLEPIGGGYRLTRRGALYFDSLASALV